MMCLYIKQTGETSLVDFKQSLLKNKEYLSISPSHLLFYDLDKPQNKLLEKYGMAVFGDVIITKSDDKGEIINIEENIVQLLEQIIEDDKKQRELFFTSFNQDSVLKK